METALCAAVGTASHRHGLETSSVYADKWQKCNELLSIQSGGKSCFFFHINHVFLQHAHTILPCKAVPMDTAQTTTQWRFPFNMLTHFTGALWDFNCCVYICTVTTLRSLQLLKPTVWRCSPLHVVAKHLWLTGEVWYYVTVHFFRTKINQLQRTTADTKAPTHQIIINIELPVRPFNWRISWVMDGVGSG